MTAKLIANPQSLNGEPVVQVGGTTAMQNDYLPLVFNNNSGTNRTYGDVMIIDVTGQNATTTTTAGDTKVIGPVSQEPKTVYATGTTMPVISTPGSVARVNIGSGTIATAALLTTSATAGVATSSATPTAGQVFAIALESSTSKDSNNTIRCLIKYF